MVAPEVVPGLKLLNRLQDGAGQRDQSVGPRHRLVVHDTSIVRGCQTLFLVSNTARKNQEQSLTPSLFHPSSPSLLEPRTKSDTIPLVTPSLLTLSLSSLGRMIDSYDDQLGTAKRELAIAQDQLRDLRDRIGRPFAYEAFKSQLTDLRDQLKVGLSENPPEGTTPVSELAERIKALREANTVEAAPDRTGTRKAVRAERPVTARIRRKAEGAALVGAEPEAKQEPAPVEEPKAAEPVGTDREISAVSEHSESATNAVSFLV